MQGRFYNFNKETMMETIQLKIKESITQIEIDKYRPIYYAAASGDFSPLHIDPELARSFGLKRNILHGLCTVAMVIDAVGSMIGNPDSIKKFRCRFASPLFPGDTVVISAEEFSGNTLAVNVCNQSNSRILDKVVIDIEDAVTD